MAPVMEARVRRRLLQRSLLFGTPEEGTEQYEAWTANQTDSPLLRLPPELRNRIYELVLTAGIIAVHQRPVAHVWRVHNAAAAATAAYNAPHKVVLPGGFFCRRLHTSENPYVDGGGGGRHSLTGVEEQGMTLLAPVSRQLYRETALLPFQLNAWCFESAAVMERYVLRERRLAPEQRRAVRTLYVDAAFTGGTLAHKCFGELEMLVWCSRMDGMRAVVLPRRHEDKKRALARSWAAGQLGHAVELFDT